MDGKQPDTEKRSSFLNRWTKVFVPIFITLGIISFFIKVQRGWSILEWLQSLGMAFLVAGVIGLIAAVASIGDKDV